MTRSTTTVSIKALHVAFNNSITTLPFYAECHYSGCCILFIVLLYVVMQSVVILDVVILNASC
jgi:hypothetical protein